jgi:hypothetical protein
MAQAAEIRLVWVLTATDVYHNSGTRWYGKTKQGKFMSEAEAPGSRIPTSSKRAVTLRKERRNPLAMHVVVPAVFSMPDGN